MDRRPRPAGQCLVRVVATSAEALSAAGSRLARGALHCVRLDASTVTQLAHALRTPVGSWCCYCGAARSDSRCRPTACRKPSPAEARAAPAKLVRRARACGRGCSWACAACAASVSGRASLRPRVRCPARHAGLRCVPARAACVRQPPAVRLDVRPVRVEADELLSRLLLAHLGDEVRVTVRAEPLRINVSRRRVRDLHSRAEYGASPAIPCRRTCHAAGDVGLGQQPGALSRHVAKQTPARATISCPQVRGDDGRLGAAVTLALPTSAVLDARRAMKRDKPTEPLSGQV